MGEGSTVFEWAMGGILLLAISTSFCSRPNNQYQSQLYQNYSTTAQNRYTRSLLDTAEDYARDRPLRMRFYLMQAEGVGDESQRLRRRYFLGF